MNRFLNSSSYGLGTCGVLTFSDTWDQRQKEISDRIITTKCKRKTLVWRRADIVAMSQFTCTV